MARRFERNLNAATDSTLLEPNWDEIMHCVEAIRSGDVSPKAALYAIQKRMNSTNPHIALYSLFVLEACVKNCGPSFHKEVFTTWSIIENMRLLPKLSHSEQVQQKVLELIQCWAVAFAGNKEYQNVVELHRRMQFEGIKFPSLKEADAMFLSKNAPSWRDGKVCYRCRTHFGMITRKHHCRACGQVFCDGCSRHQMVLPDLGFEKLVRVCDTCHSERSSSEGTRGLKTTADQFKKAPAADTGVIKNRDVELDDMDREQLALAIEISKHEAEQKNKEMQKQRELLSWYNGAEASPDLSISREQSFCDNSISTICASTTTLNEPPVCKNETFKYSSFGLESNPGKPGSEENVVDPELTRYLDKDYWNKRRAELDTKDVDVRASAPPPSEFSFSGSSSLPKPFPDRAPVLNGDQPPPNNDEGEVAETAKFCQGLEQQVATLECRIRSNLNRGRSIINDTAAQAQFVQLAETHAEILRRMSGLDDQREYYEGLQDRIAHISEARSAVTALREDYEQQKQEALQREREARQRQMQEMLERMRIKKQEMLIQQRHDAYKKFQGAHDMQVHNSQPVLQTPYSVQQPQYAAGSTIDSLAPMSTVTREAFTVDPWAPSSHPSDQQQNQSRGPVDDEPPLIDLD